METKKLNSIVKLIICWYFFIFFSTLLLSYFHLLLKPIIQVADIIFFISIIYINNKEIPGLIKKLPRYIKSNVLLVIILLLTFIQGLFSAPSTTDSMVYHLPRIIYWLQEKTVFQDVIHNPHDMMAPFAEYIYLHLYSLINSDRLLFFSQWLAYLVSIYLCFLISKMLMIDEKIRKLIILFVATMPIALMQSVSTQIDLVVAVLVLLGVYLSLVLTAVPKFSTALILGGVLGLGIFTKATFIIYLVFPAGILLHKFIFSRNWKLMFLSAIVGIVMVITPLPYFLQNIQLYGTPLGKFIFKDGTELIFTNEKISLGITASNFIRNSLVNIPIPLYSDQVEQIVLTIHKFLQLDINDTRSTCCGMKFNLIKVIYPQEDIVANPIHFLLIILASFLGIINLWRSKGKDLISYIYFLSILSFVLFAVVLKYQPYHPRLEIPFLIMGTISSVALFAKSNLGKLLKIALVFSIVLGLSVVILNVSRPYLSYKYFFNNIKQFSTPTAVIPEAFYIRSRDEQYFNASYFWYGPYNQVTDYIAMLPDNKIIAFDLMDNFQYPLWLMLSQKLDNFKIVPLSQTKHNTIVITTHEKKINNDTCYKTSIDYGFACVSVRQ